MKNRWLLALCAVGIHVSIGSIYAWSQIAVAITKQIDAPWGLGQITITFTIAIVILGLSAAFMGHFVEKHGPRVSGILAALLFGAGLIGGGFALHKESLLGLYLTYGVLGGAGIGIGYITPVSTLLKWFPDKRGLATGMTIMGFGFGAAIEVFLLQHLLPAVGISSVATGLIVLGLVYAILMLLSSLYLAPPPAGWQPKMNKDSLLKANIKKDLSNITANESLKDIKFYLLWLMLFINICCGIALLSVAKFMAGEVILMTASAAAVVVMMMSVFNGLGRIIWASASDVLTRPITYILFFSIQIVAFFVVTQTTNVIIFQVAVYLILTCYGGGFSVIPAYIGDVFGTKEVGAIHGYMLTAWSAAGVVGPLLIAYTRQWTGGYNNALFIFIGFLAIALMIAVFMAKHIKRIRKQQGG